VEPELKIFSFFLLSKINVTILKYTKQLIYVLVGNIVEIKTKKCVLNLGCGM